LGGAPQPGENPRHASQLKQELNFRTSPVQCREIDACRAIPYIV
jgi:hypothetical protein